MFLNEKRKEDWFDWEQEIQEYLQLYQTQTPVKHYPRYNRTIQEKQTIMDDGAIERRKLYQHELGRAHQRVTTYGYRDCPRCYGTGTYCCNPSAGVQREYEQCPDCFRRHFS